MSNITFQIKHSKELATTPIQLDEESKHAAKHAAVKNKNWRECINRWLSLFLDHPKLKYSLLFIAGFTSAYGFAPYYMYLLFLVSFPVLMYFTLHSKSYKDSFFIGWFFGFGYFLNGLYWISYSLLVDSDAFGWIVPFAITIIPSLLSLYIGILCITLRYIFPESAKKHNILFSITFISLWVLFEILRTYLFTGFPWMAIGYALSDFNAMMQSASIGGVFLVSVVVLCGTSIPFIILSTLSSNSNKLSRKLNLKPMVVCLVFLFIVAANYMYGYDRLKNAENEFYDQKIKLVQPNIKQTLKWDPKEQYQNLVKIMRMSTEGGLAKDDIVLWPESATSMYSMENVFNREWIAKIIPEFGYLMTGGIRQSNGLLYNSVFIIDRQAQIVSHYDKIHLVPFGEYIPLRDFIPFDVKKISHGLADFSQGTSMHTIKINKKSPAFRILICYESFFGKEIAHNDSESQENRADILVNFTNDAWYRDSPGIYQHFDLTRVRAIENGKSMIRIANTGISAVTSPYGEIMAIIHLNIPGNIYQKLIKPIENSTLYAIYKDYILIILLLFIVIWAKFFNNKRT